MMHLMCHVANLRFAMPIDDVIEVVGRPSLDPVPASPDWIAGSFVHRGVITPVIDIAVLAGIGQSQLLWSSRVIVVKREIGNRSLRLGLLVDSAHAEQVPSRKMEDSIQSAVQIWPWGKTIIDEQGTYCRLDLNTLLSAERQVLLFPVAV